MDFFQCNLNYFLRHFDMGVCLHACGIATDLVLRKCLRLNAAFVACPCCYGSVRGETTADVGIAFPKSSAFKTTGITWKVKKFGFLPFFCSELSWRPEAKKLSAFLYPLIRFSTFCLALYKIKSLCFAVLFGAISWWIFLRERKRKRLFLKVCGWKVEVSREENRPRLRSFVRQASQKVGLLI